MKRPRIDVASVRRAQIVEAAVAIIAEQGLQNLSLSQIEQKAAMSRGQLTYYFPAKEDILLAVFDRLLEMMYQRIGTPPAPEGKSPGGWRWVRHLLETVPASPRHSPEFCGLQFTFLAQMGPRADFRKRLARLFEEWRGNMARGLQEDLAARPPRRAASPRALATLVQALLHGLVMQAAADPKAYDHQEMIDLAVDLLSGYLWGDAEAKPRIEKKRAKIEKATNGRPRK
jgi:AcrR family transcriptional regulator